MPGRSHPRRLVPGPAEAVGSVDAEREPPRDAHERLELDRHLRPIHDAMFRVPPTSPSPVAYPSRRPTENRPGDPAASPGRAAGERGEARARSDPGPRRRRRAARRSPRRRLPRRVRSRGTPRSRPSRRAARPPACGRAPRARARRGERRTARRRGRRRRPPRPRHRDDLVEPEERPGVGDGPRAIPGGQREARPELRAQRRRDGEVEEDLRVSFAQVGGDGARAELSERPGHAVAAPRQHEPRRGEAETRGRRRAPARREPRSARRAWQRVRPGARRARARPPRRGGRCAAPGRR